MVSMKAEMEAKEISLNHAEHHSSDPIRARPHIFYFSLG
jgi:hypothetical protein